MLTILRRAPFTAGLLAVIAAVYLLEVGLLLLGSDYQQVLLTLGANRWPLDGQYWRLLASMFLHIGFIHALVNSWALYQLGALFEIWVGWKRMATVYFASGLLGSAASLWFTLRPAEGPTLSAGASGAIFGILGALIAFLARRRDRLTPQAKSLLLQLLFWAGLNVFLGLTAAAIDNSAHMGGFVTGLALGAFLEGRRDLRRPPAPQDEAMREPGGSSDGASFGPPPAPAPRRR